jgi:hypothetical protein
MFSFDWHRFLLNDLNFSFLGEVAFRVLIAGDAANLLI